MEAKSRVEGENCWFAVAERILGMVATVGSVYRRKLTEKSAHVCPSFYFLISNEEVFLLLTAYERRGEIVCLYKEIGVKSYGDSSLAERSNREMV